MGIWGPDFNLDFDPAAHRRFSVPPGTRARASIWGDGVLEQGLMLYLADGTAIGIMRTSPGVDDPFGAQLRSGARLLEPGEYILGGYSKYNGEWHSSPWQDREPKGPDRMTTGFDDYGNQGNILHKPPDRDFNDIIISFLFEKS